MLVASKLSKKKKKMMSEAAIEAVVLDQRSSSEEKIRLFRSLFRGRNDVYPRRFESRTTGRSGYAPACADARVPVELDGAQHLADRLRTAAIGARTSCSRRTDIWCCGSSLKTSAKNWIWYSMRSCEPRASAARLRRARD